MPQIRPVRVHSASPSHEKYPASNLILSSGDKKAGWKCRDQGEKNAFVVLELAEPTLINGIDIGNEHSCFIEVQVGNRENPDDFKELLLTSSFQTPTESRNSENTNRVRCFGKVAFVESNATKKWDLVKLNCTQPFNSRVQYGVSFVTIYSADEPKATVAPPKEEVAKKGNFSIREASPESDLETNSTSLFSRWKQTKQQQGGGAEGTATTPARVSAAAAIRDARTSIGERKSPMLLTPTTTVAKKRPSTETPVLDRNRNHLLYDSSDDEKGDEKLEKLIEKDKKRAEEQLQAKEQKKPDKEKEKPVESTPAKKFRFSENKKDEATPSRSTKEKDPQPAQVKPKKPKTYKPFRKLLEGVVITISGIQNPERGNLRSKALEMGAKYRGDWDSTCTHLICAFRNTPKYNQVQGIGKIVKRDWVLQCHANKMHIPWRRFALDSREGEKSESEAEICDEAEREEKEVSAAKTSTTTTSTAEPEEQEKEKKAEEEDDDILMVYDQVDEAPVVICDSGSDTEDEIEKVRASAAKKHVEEEIPVVVEKEKEPPKEDAETERLDSSSTAFLTGKRFYLDEDNGAIKIIKCHSIITKYGGEVIESKEKSDFWIKSSRPSAEFLNSEKLPVLRPLWLEESQDMDCLLPIKRYLH